MIYLPSLWFSFFGFIFLLIALFFKHPTIGNWDTLFFVYINKNLDKFAGIFKFIWPLGTTPVAILLICIPYFEGRFIGTSAALALIGISAIEFIIKKLQMRLRPFKALPEIKMHQPSYPNDSSFPSGDAMRIWYLAFVIPVVFDLGMPFFICSCLVAICISLGRIVLGVHYPLDVIGGIGLGLLGVSFVMSKLQFIFSPL